MKQSFPDHFPTAEIADAVGLFATLFGAPLEEPDIDAIRLLEDRGAQGPMARIEIIRSGVGELAGIVRGLGGTADAVTQLNRDYCFLFLGTGGEGAAPYESAYHGSGRLFQEPVGEMEALLERCGQKLADGFSEPADHLAIELSLLQETLCRAASSGSPEDAALAREVWARLRRWVPHFEAACRQHDTTGFYANTAALLSRLLADETVCGQQRTH